MTDAHDLAASRSDHTSEESGQASEPGQSGQSGPGVSRALPWTSASEHPEAPTGGEAPATRASEQPSTDLDGVAPAVLAKSIQVSGEEGPAYGPLDVTIPGRGLTVLSGRGGSGRTALALTISGRMAISSGELSVLGESKPKRIRNKVAIAGVDSIDLLNRSVTVREVLTEHRCWSRPWISWTKRADDVYRDSLCAELYGDRDLPPLDVYISQISGLDRLLLRIALALHPANGSTIEMLVMDDLEQVRELEDRLVLLNLLANLAESMPVVVNAVNPLPKELGPKHSRIDLFTDLSHLQPENTGI